MRKILGVLSAIGTGTVLFILPVQAAVYATDPATLIQAVTGEVTEIVKTRTGADREAAIRQLLQTNFDLRHMGSKALGTHWSQASEQQRVRFLAAVETSDARAYSERLGNFAGATVTIGIVSTRPNSTWMVDSTLTLASGQPIKLEWEVHDSSQGLRIADLKISGVSMFMTRRADFNSYIQSHGGTVEPLVKVLEARAAR
jgi:phospholipid transport system substrate-binding protein